MTISKGASPISSRDGVVDLVVLLGVLGGEEVEAPLNLRSRTSSTSSLAGVVDLDVFLGVLGAEEVEAPLNLRLLLRDVVTSSLAGEDLVTFLWEDK